MCGGGSGGGGWATGSPLPPSVASVAFEGGQEVVLLVTVR